MVMKSIFARNSDAALAIFVVAVAAMLLIPLPTPLLDLLLAINLSFSLLLLLVGLYIPNALALLAFPALLLLTTLFRLSLNVASTRLILSNGYAGEVIQSFGDFLIAGDPVIGGVIFTIITIVNFIVITRGAGRVSEVSARFALDALPGKQMAIDTDLRAGIISAEEACRKREDLRKESQLYGAMDGAMKFVQGDAIAGIFIIFTNILGGLYVGVLRGEMSFSEAVSTYTVLTVGDGLVSQVPALLISICAGIVVTRVSSGENTTLGKDIVSQLFQSSFLIAVASVVILIVGLLPNMPFWPFLFTSLCLAGVALYHSGRGGQTGERALLRQAGIGFAKGSVAEEVDDFEKSRLDIFLDAALLFKSYQVAPARHFSRYSELQHDFYEATGVQLPPLKVHGDKFFSPSHYKVCIGETTLFSGRIPTGAILIEMNPETARSFGLEIESTEMHPISGNAIAWCADTTNLRRFAEAGAIRIFDFMEYITLRAAAFLQRHPEEVLSIVDVHAELKDIQQRYPGLIPETFNSEFINVSRMTTILQKLASEGISVRNFRQILGSVASYCSVYGASMVQEDDFDVQDIVSFIRIDRKRQTLGRLLSHRETLKVISVSTDIEEALEGVQITSQGGASVIDPQTFEAMQRGLQQIAEQIALRGLLPVSILCPVGLRHKLSDFLQLTYDYIDVVTFDELDPTIQVETIGVWQI